MTRLAVTVGWGLVLAALAAPLPAQVKPPTGAAATLNGADLEAASSGRDGLAAVLAAEQQTADAQRAMASVRHDAAPVANPLDHFMAAWLSPADFRLLLSKSPAAWPVVTGGSGALIGARSASANGAVAAKVNPYLAEIPDPAAPTAASGSKQIDHADKGSSTLPAAAAMPTAVSTGASPPPASPPAAGAVEAWKARDDAKYFKQLKRF